MPTERAKQRQHRIAAEIAGLGFCLPGSLVTRTTRCGSPRCRCHSDPDGLHGPYLSWICKVGTKTITRNLSVTQVERYKPWFENAKKLRQLTKELETLSIQALAQAEGWELDEATLAK